MRIFSMILVLMLTLTTLFSCVKDSECIDESLIDKDAATIEVYDPVCGCDNITYSNSSKAEVHGGVTSYTKGACK